MPGDCCISIEDTDIPDDLTCRDCKSWDFCMGLFQNMGNFDLDGKKCKFSPCQFAMKVDIKTNCYFYVSGDVTGPRNCNRRRSHAFTCTGCHDYITHCDAFKVVSDYIDKREDKSNET